MTQKTATLVPEAPHKNGAVYQVDSSKTRLLLFDPSDSTNEQYRGLQVFMRMKIPMNLYFLMAAPIQAGDPEFWAKVCGRHREFAERALVSWNVVYPANHPKAGESIPATPDGFMEIDVDMANAIRDAWFFTLRTPDSVVEGGELPLGSESSDTSQ